MIISVFTIQRLSIQTLNVLDQACQTIVTKEKLFSLINVSDIGRVMNLLGKSHAFSQYLENIQSGSHDHRIDRKIEDFNKKLTAAQNELKKLNEENEAIFTFWVKVRSKI